MGWFLDSTTPLFVGLVLINPRPLAMVASVSGINHRPPQHTHRSVPRSFVSCHWEMVNHKPPPHTHTHSTRWLPWRNTSPGPCPTRGILQDRPCCSVSCVAFEVMGFGIGIGGVRGQTARGRGWLRAARPGICEGCELRQTGGGAIEGRTAPAGRSAIPVAVPGRSTFLTTPPRFTHVAAMLPGVITLGYVSVCVVKGAR